jgi:hypothetical protein
LDTDHLSSFYLGKKVAFVYRGQKEIRGTKIRVIWGKVTRPHGKSISTCHDERWLTLYTRQLRRRPRQVHLPSPHQVLRCFCSRHAVPIFDIKKGLRAGVGSEGGSHLAALVEARIKHIALL